MIFSPKSILFLWNFSQRSGVPLMACPNGPKLELVYLPVNRELKSFLILFKRFHWLPSDRFFPQCNTLVFWAWQPDTFPISVLAFFYEKINTSFSLSKTLEWLCYCFYGNECSFSIISAYCIVSDTFRKFTRNIW